MGDLGVGLLQVVGVGVGGWEGSVLLLGEVVPGHPLAAGGQPGSGEGGGGAGGGEGGGGAVLVLAGAQPGLEGVAAMGTGRLPPSGGHGGGGGLAQPGGHGY